MFYLDDLKYQSNSSRWQELERYQQQYAKKFTRDERTNVPL